MHTDHEASLKEIQKQWHGNAKSYAIGFIGSLLLTALSFFLAWTHLLEGSALILTIIGLGLAQAILQLIFFLHLGQESKPRWELLIFLFMVMVLFIIVLGTIWIMYDLNERVMAGMT